LSHIMAGRNDRIIAGQNHKLQLLVIAGKLDFRKIKVLLLDTAGYYWILVDTGRWRERPEVRSQRVKIFSRQGGVLNRDIVTSQ